MIPNSEDTELYEYWDKLFRLKANRQEVFDSDFNNFTVLVPLAGEGLRFKKAGYSIPKPLVSVSGHPLVIQSVRDFPKGSKYIFLCRTEHIRKFHIDKILKDSFSNSKIVEVKNLTKGQASTCLLAEKETDPERPLLIIPCDVGIIWDMNSFKKTLSHNPDAIIWTFRKYPLVKKNPEMYGWVKTDSESNAIKISCKIPISSRPENDHAIIGAFFFRKGKYFTSYTKRMINKQRNINGEYYIDECMNELIEDGLRVKIFEVGKFLCWGTPQDLEKYQEWQRIFNNDKNHPYSTERDEDFK